MTVTVTGLPEPLPNPADPSTFSDRASATLSAINPMMAQMNEQNIENNAINAAVNLLADEAELSATASMSSANYKGPWLTLVSSLVGYPAFPAFSSVFHNGVFWFSNSAMADVSVNEPSSTSTFWTSIQQQNTGARNLVYNGKIEVAQSGTSFLAASGYVMDGYKYASALSGACNVSQSTIVPAGLGFYNSIAIVCATAKATLDPGSYAILSHSIEGVEARRIYERTFTISFRVRSAKAGVHCLAFRNGALTRSLIKEYTVIAANTWERKSITITGGLPSSVTWDFSAGAKGLEIDFALAAGVDFQSAKDVWGTSGIATSNQVNVVDSVSNSFFITGIQVEAGKYATEFEHRGYPDELRFCKRYYERMDTTFGPTSAPTTNRLGFWDVEKCKTPTVTYQNYALPGSTATCSFAPLENGSKTTFYQDAVGTGGSVYVKTAVIGDARL